MGFEADNNLQRLAFHFRVAGNEDHGRTMSNLRLRVAECSMQSNTKLLVPRTKDQFAKAIPDLRIPCQQELADTAQAVHEQAWSPEFGIMNKFEQETPPARMTSESIVAGLTDVSCNDSCRLMSFSGYQLSQDFFGLRYITAIV